MGKGSMEEDDGDTTSEAGRVVVYQVAAQHWAHAEQIRWTLLYNYLMASTILLLAWATVFTANNPTKRWVLLALSLAGMILSAVWVALGASATGFIRTYERTGLTAEVNVQRSNGPFAAAHEHRQSVTGIAKLAPSWFVLRLVPSLFVALYLLLAFISICQT